MVAIQSLTRGKDRILGPPRLARSVPAIEEGLLPCPVWRPIRSPISKIRLLTERLPVAPALVQITNRMSLDLCKKSGLDLAGHTVIYKQTSATLSKGNASVPANRSNLHAYLLAALAGAADLLDRVTLFGQSPSFALLFFFKFLTAEPVRSSDFFKNAEVTCLTLQGSVLRWTSQSY
jgi:hypothetical protein